MKTIMIRISDELHIKFKMCAVKQKKTMTEILLEAVKKTIKEDSDEK